MIGGNDNTDYAASGRQSGDRGDESTASEPESGSILRDPVDARGNFPDR
jgi:hypothetical protein